MNRLHQDGMEAHSKARRNGRVSESRVLIAMTVSRKRVLTQESSTERCRDRLVAMRDSGIWKRRQFAVERVKSTISALEDTFLLGSRQCLDFSEGTLIRYQIVFSMRSWGFWLFLIMNSWGKRPVIQWGCAPRFLNLNAYILRQMLQQNFFLHFPSCLVSLLSGLQGLVVQREAWSPPSIAVPSAWFCVGGKQLPPKTGRELENAFSSSLNVT
jgi:hypothetical protein